MFRFLIYFVLLKLCATSTHTNIKSTRKSEIHKEIGKGVEEIFNFFSSPWYHEDLKDKTEHHHKQQQLPSEASTRQHQRKPKHVVDRSHRPLYVSSAPGHHHLKTTTHHHLSTTGHHHPSTISNHHLSTIHHHHSSTKIHHHHLSTLDHHHTSTINHHHPSTVNHHSSAINHHHLSTPHAHHPHPTHHHQHSTPANDHYPKSVHHQLTTSRDHHHHNLPKPQQHHPPPIKNNHIPSTDHHHLPPTQHDNLRSTQHDHDQHQTVQHHHLPPVQTAQLHHPSSVHDPLLQPGRHPPSPFHYLTSAQSPLHHHPTSPPPPLHHHPTSPPPPLHHHPTSPPPPLHHHPTSPPPPLHHHPTSPPQPQPLIHEQNPLHDRSVTPRGKHSTVVIEKRSPPASSLQHLQATILLTNEKNPKMVQEKEIQNKVMEVKQNPMKTQGKHDKAIVKQQEEIRKKLEDLKGQPNQNKSEERQTEEPQKKSKSFQGKPKESQNQLKVPQQKSMDFQKANEGTLKEPDEVQKNMDGPQNDLKVSQKQPDAVKKESNEPKNKTEEPRIDSKEGLKQQKIPQDELIEAQNEPKGSQNEAKETQKQPKEAQKESKETPKQSKELRKQKNQRPADLPIKVLRLYSDCDEAVEAHGGHDGIYILEARGNKILAYCRSHPAGLEGSWLVIQRRGRGRLDFNRGSKDYKQGFGDVRGEFWIGLKTIHTITTSRRCRLLVVMKDEWNRMQILVYSNFTMGNENTGYSLMSLGSARGNVQDPLSQHVGEKFLQKDMNNEESLGSCALMFRSRMDSKDCHVGEAPAGVAFWNPMNETRGPSLPFLEMAIRCPP